jgi:cell wall-associated NlpC family hydrolase
MLLTLAAVACGATTAVPRPFPVPGSSDSRTTSAEREIQGIEGRAVAETALSLTGRPYRLGGADPSGFDCSGLVQYVFARHGLGTPRVVEDQVQLGRRLEADEIGPGDLVFFKVDSRRPSHVGIAIDEARFVHAPRTGSRVRVDALDAPYWRKRYVEARRIEVPPSGGAVLTFRDEAP